MAEDGCKCWNRLQIFLEDKRQFQRAERILAEADRNRIEHRVLVRVALAEQGEPPALKRLQIQCHGASVLRLDPSSARLSCVLLA